MSSSQYQQNMNKYLELSRPVETIQAYSIYSNDVICYCKFKKYECEGTISYTISLGGNRQYCIVLSGKCKMDETIEELYLDRVEYNSRCSKSEDLQKGKGTKGLLRCALWFATRMFPTLKIVKLMDDSHIYCNEESRQYKLPLACDYIIKYNETWYQSVFKATLSPTLLSEFNTSIKQLDEPIEPIQVMLDKGASYLQEFSDEYMKSKTPREFIQMLRKKFGDETYCYKVSPWLARYFEILHISIHKNSWYIPVNEIKIPLGYKHEETAVALRGGRKTLKSAKKYRYSILPYSGNGYDANGYIGTIRDYEL